MAEQSRWKKNIYSNVIISEEKSKSRLELQARAAKDRAAEEARKEREQKMIAAPVAQACTDVQQGVMVVLVLLVQRKMARVRIMIRLNRKVGRR